MSFIVHPDTGQLLSNLIEKARADARTRLLISRGTRAILTDYGTNLLDVLEGEPGAIGSFQSQCELALGESPYYAVERVLVTVNGGRITAQVRLKLPDGTDLSFQIPLGTPPSATASASVAQVYGGREVMLSGGGTDFDGVIDSYQWTANPNIYIRRTSTRVGCWLTSGARRRIWASLPTRTLCLPLGRPLRVLPQTRRLP